MLANSNLRLESFGGTLFDIHTGKRIYLDKKEAQQIVSSEKVTLDGNTFEAPIVIVKPPMLLGGNFSFADTAFIEVTRKCNLHCIHCLNNSGKELENTLSSNEIQTLIKKLAKAGIQEIRFTGGEPLLNPHIYDFIQSARRLGIRPSIGTNATLITPDVAIKLKESGLQQAIISLDGTENTHDRIRGKNSFKKALTGIKYLQEQGILIRINSVLMKNNYRDIIRLMRELNSRHLPTFIRRFIESGRGNTQFSQVLSKQDYDYIREELTAELNGKYIRGHYLSNEKVKPRIELPFERRACSAGQRGLVILPDGNIHSCGFLAAQGEKPLGNVRNIKDFSNFWIEMSKKDSLKALRDELSVYNRKVGVQQTTCLAYVAYKLKENTK